MQLSFCFWPFLVNLVALLMVHSDDMWFSLVFCIVKLNEAFTLIKRRVVIYYLHVILGVIGIN